MEIDKDKIWKYVNISDGVFGVCFLLGVLFFRDNALNIAAGWLVTFICSGLGLRLYCKGKGMMRYGTINNVEDDDHEGFENSYRAHRGTVIFCTIGVVAFTIYQLYQSFV
ncbi:hypothetical protein [Vibrio owensii]|uniref:hypothetical protein n=1 Tax=Vibrio owensii TaxID=696485 RepID=UPI0038CEC899